AECTMPGPILHLSALERRRFSGYGRRRRGQVQVPPADVRPRSAMTSTSNQLPNITSGQTGPDESHRLRERLGVVQLLFTVLAFNGPLAIVVGFVPVIIGYGNGLGAPTAYVAASVIVGLFADGFIKMSRHVEKPGRVSTHFVAKGLGRPLGLGASFLAVACY